LRNHGINLLNIDYKIYTSITENELAKYLSARSATE
jgi:hypothetical protein